MARQTVLLGTLTIASGGTQSNVLTCPVGGVVTGFTIYCPAALTGTVTLYAGPTDSLAITSLLPVRLGAAAADVTLVAAKAQYFEFGAFRALGVISGGAEGAARTFTVVANVEF